MIIDFCAHCGYDEVSSLSHNIMNERFFDTARFVELAQAAGIERSVVSGSENESLIRFPTLSPASDVAEVGSVKGVRIFPTYQIWDFDGEEMASVLAAAKRSGLIVQICLRLQDPRVLVQKTPSGEVLKALDKLAEVHKDVRFAVSGANYYEAQANSALFSRQNVWMDISHVQHPINSLEKLLAVVDAGRVLFATNSPIFYPKTAVYRVIHSAISDLNRDRFLYQNAKQLLG